MAFDFGSNWSEYSAHALTDERLARSRADFVELLRSVELVDASFLDIGFGQGLALLHAAAAGARVVGCDLDPQCADAACRNAERFAPRSTADLRLLVGSILDRQTIEQLRQIEAAGFDIVHAWGSLHHTGDMWRAIDIAASLVGDGGHLVLAIYNQHWSSPLWRLIKRLYSATPAPLKRLWVWLLYPVIWLAKLLVTGRDPRRKQRGMDFYYDVVDWVGGYPYEFASLERLRAHVEQLGFECCSARRATVPTGCNEVVFHRRPKAARP